MSDWLHNLPVGWMAVVVLGGTYLIAAAIFVGVSVLAKGERQRAFKAVSPGLLSPLGVLFGLLVAFTAAQVWSDNDQANAAVNREASALRAALILGDTLPAESAAYLRTQIRRYTAEVTTEEWPQMAAGTATLGTGAHHLAGALVSIMKASATDTGPQPTTASLTGIITSLQTVLDARRQRILISQRSVGLSKWCCILIQAVGTLFAIALVHSDNRLAAILAMGIFATGVGASVLLISAYDRPFTGHFAVPPEPLLQATAEQ